MSTFDEKSINKKERIGIVLEYTNTFRFEQKIFSVEEAINLGASNFELVVIFDYSKAHDLNNDQFKKNNYFNNFNCNTMIFLNMCIRMRNVSLSNFKIQYTLPKVLPESLSILKNLNFFEVAHFDNPSTNIIHKNYFPLQILKDNNAIPLFRDNLRRWIEGILNSKDHDLLPLTTALLEISNNIEHHTEIKQGYFFATYNEEQKEFCFVMSDFGGGIPNNLRKKAEYQHLTEKEALLKALERGVSTAKKYGRGEGLNYFKETIQNYYHGFLTIISGKIGHYFYQYENWIETEIEFDATLIEFFIKADMIPLRDEADFNVDSSGDIWNV